MGCSSPGVTSCWRWWRCRRPGSLLGPGDGIRQEQPASSTNDDFQQRTQLLQLAREPAPHHRPKQATTCSATRGDRWRSRLDARHGERAAQPLPLNTHSKKHWKKSTKIKVRIARTICMYFYLFFSLILTRNGETIVNNWFLVFSLISRLPIKRENMIPPYFKYLPVSRFLTHFSFNQCDGRIACIPSQTLQGSLRMLVPRLLL